MEWLQFDIWRTGEAHVVIDGIDTPCEFDIGTIVTGRQRVFKAYYIRVELPSGEEIHRADRYGVRAAVFADRVPRRGVVYLGHRRFRHKLEPVMRQVQPRA